VPTKLLRPVVLFDLDGTLANSIDLIVESYQYAFATVAGRQVTRAQACSWIGQTLTQTFRTEDAERAAELETTYRAFNNSNLDRIMGYPGTPELLDGLRSAGAVTGVVTSKGRGAADASLRQVGLAGAIDVLAARDDTTAHKPDPAPLLFALAGLGAAPAEAAYVGDAVFDVQAARAAGMTAIAVTWGAGLTDELAGLGPDALCATMDELRGVLMPTAS